MAYFKIKKIVIKKIQTKCEGKINGRGCSKILHGWCKFQGGEREEGKIKMVFGAKPAALCLHTYITV
jgi:hypothetical protein